VPDREELGILCLFGLLAVLYVVGLVLKYLIEYWYVVILSVGAIVAFRAWLRRRYPIYLDDEDEDGYLEPVPQE
jgi:hypothetical protein